MEFFKKFRRKSFLSELVYVGLNIAFAIALLVIAQTVVSPLLAFILVFLSKWRVLAVRPLYWIANIQANLVDFIVSLSVVVLMYSVVDVQYELLLQSILTVLYIGWLVILKPRSSRRAIILQAAASLVLGTSALFVVSYGWNEAIVVLGMAIIGYVVTRHALTLYDEDYLQSLCLIVAFLLAVLGWTLNHWVIAYATPGIEVFVPQAALIIGLITFVLYKVYDSYQTNEKVRPEDVTLPILFSVGVIGTLLLVFNSIPIGIS